VFILKLEHQRIFLKEKFILILSSLKRLVVPSVKVLHARFVHWTKPLTSSLPLGTLADLARSKPELVAEAVRAWKQTLFIVQPETLLRWHREAFRLFWRRKSKAHSHKPKVAAETIALIREMATKNRRLRC
jgi:putative transposase